MRKTVFGMLIILLWCCVGVKTFAAEGDDIDMQSLHLKINPTQYFSFQPQTQLLQNQASKYQITFMRTNEGVKPYKFMDDMTFVGVPFFLAGLIAKSEKKAFRVNDGTRHVLLTNFSTRIDDYTQYVAPVLTVGLKLGGVEGRSDWGRFLASTAMSYALTAGLVNGVKYTAKELRPDGSSYNSWPSGHTATAFAGATILHKEYGLTRSPWYSIAGYGLATATGVMRVLNNRHWISDVLSGAGIGIVSTELAYVLSDVIFKEKGLLRNDLETNDNLINHPSFVSISMGLGFGSKSMDFDMNDEDEGNDFHLKFRPSTAVQAEAAYFINKYMGVGGRLRVNASAISGWDRVRDFANNDVANLIRSIDADADLSGYKEIVFRDEGPQPEFMIYSDHLTEFAADLGVYFNLPLSKRFALGAKVLGGRSVMQELDLSAHFQGKVKDCDISYDEQGEMQLNVFDTGETYDTTWDYFVLNANNTMKVGTGISATYAYKNRFLWKIFVDYDYARKTYTLTYDPARFTEAAMPSVYKMFQTNPELREVNFLDPQEQSITKDRHTCILGASFAISF